MTNFEKMFGRTPDRSPSSGYVSPDYPTPYNMGSMFDDTTTNPETKKTPQFNGDNLEHKIPALSTPWSIPQIPTTPIPVIPPVQTIPPVPTIPTTPLPIPPINTPVGVPPVSYGTPFSEQPAAVPWFGMPMPIPKPIPLPRYDFDMKVDGIVSVAAIDEQYFAPGTIVRIRINRSGNMRVTPFFAPTYVRLVSTRMTSDEAEGFVRQVGPYFMTIMLADCAGNVIETIVTIFDIFDGYVTIENLSKVKGVNMMQKPDESTPSAQNTEPTKPSTQILDNVVVNPLAHSSQHHTYGGFEQKQTPSIDPHEITNGIIGDNNN